MSHATRTWVVGGGGLLGSAVVRAVAAGGGGPLVVPVRWGGDAMSDLEAGIERLQESDGDRWRIVWAAGAGVTATSPDALARERETLARFLGAIERSGLDPDSGSLFFASSAGAVYGGAVDAPFHEFSATRPLGAYGAAKLESEGLVAEFGSQTGVRVLTGRISNLFGPGQNLAKRQGLITELCKAALLRQPASIFVSLDTLRDYLYADDCGSLIVRAMDRLHAEPTGSAVVKVLASGRSVSIAGVIGEFRGVSVRRPQVVTGQSPVASLQSRDLRLSSHIWRDLDAVAKTPLAVGIARTYADIRTRMQRGGPFRLT